MQELNRLDRAVEKPTYSNADIAELHRDGLLSRSEAEVLDIIRTSLIQDQEDSGELPETRDTQERWESCVAIVHGGALLPIFDLEEILQRAGTLVERRVVCKQVASIVYDILLALLDQREREEKE